MNPEITKGILKRARVGRWAIFRAQENGIEYHMEGKIVRITASTIELKCSSSDAANKTFDAKLGTAGDGSTIIRIINR